MSRIEQFDKIFYIFIIMDWPDKGTVLFQTVEQIPLI